MTDPKKWWLISDEDVQVIREGLMHATHVRKKRALHALDSGLHIIDAVPSDYHSSPTTARNEGCSGK